MSRAFYFGCWESTGHYLYLPSGAHAWNAELDLPWGYDLDGALAPQVARGEQEQGHARLHHKDGWTALAFWDRSADRRYGSNSAFIAEGTHDFAAMCALAERQFPAVWKRITDAFKIVLVDGGAS
jgi:hypothetical protein